MSLGTYAKFWDFQMKFTVLRGVSCNMPKNVKTEQMSIIAFYELGSEGAYLSWRTTVEKLYMGKSQNLAHQVQTCQCVLKQNFRPLALFLHT